MKVRASAKKMSDDDYGVWRKNKKGKARFYIYNKLKPKHKQRQG